MTASDERGDGSDCEKESTHLAPESQGKEREGLDNGEGEGILSELSRNKKVKKIEYR
jgi:hypothetical protein